MATNRIFSREDAKLNRASLITSRSKVYKDIDLTFSAKPNGELYTKSDAGAVKQSIKNLIQTNHFEKPFLPYFGGNVRGMLFELAYDDIDVDLETNIINNIEKYEPRAKIVSLQVNARPDTNSLAVVLEFQIVNTTETVTLTTVISRLR